MASPVTVSSMTLLRFRVVVGDAFGNFPAGESLQEGIHHVSHLRAKSISAFGGLGTIKMVLLHRLLEGLKAFAGVMEMRNGFSQTRPGQIHQ